MIDPITKDKSKIYKKIELIVKRQGQKGEYNGEIKITEYRIWAGQII